MFSSSLYALSFAYRLDALNGVCWGKFHGKGLKSKTFHQTCAIILSSVVVRRGCVKAKGIGFESSLARTRPIFFFFLLLLLLLLRGVTALTRTVSGEKQIYSANLEILPGIGKPGKFFGKYEIFSGH